MRRIKNQNGFSLLEASMSSLILGFVFFVGVVTMNNATIASANLDSRAIASQFANEKIEVIMADNYLNPNKYDYIVEDNYPSETLTYGNTDDAFTRTVEIAEVNPNDLNAPQVGSGMKRVDIKVSWGDKDYQKVDVTTLVTDY